MGAFLLLLLLFIPPLIAMAKEDKTAISDYDFDVINDPTYSTFSGNIYHLDN